MKKATARTLLPFVIAAIGITACAWAFPSIFTSTVGLSPSDNGERIYYTGINARGERIDYSGGTAFGGMMMGQQLACASCHGTEGRGGVHWMHMQRMDAPDIRWETLASGEHGGHEDDGDGEMEAYDEASFKLALTEGIEPNGEELSRDMPRWELSDQDLEDLIEFLKTLE